MNIFAYIPARAGSKRISRKNIRALGGIPVLVRVIENLRSGGLTNIAVSTDDDETAKIALAAGAITLEKRARHLSDDKTDFLGLVREDVPRYAEYFGTSNVLFSLATAGLVPATIYAEAVRVFDSTQPAVLLAVCRFPISPFWTLVRRNNGRGWMPLFSKESRWPSHMHPETRVDAGLFFALDLERTRNLSSLLEADPLDVFDVPEEIAVDVDTEDDWTELERRYELRAR